MFTLQAWLQGSMDTTSITRMHRLFEKGGGVAFQNGDSISKGIVNVDYLWETLFFLFEKSKAFLYFLHTCCFFLWLFVMHGENDGWLICVWRESLPII